MVQSKRASATSRSSRDSSLILEFFPMLEKEEPLYQVEALDLSTTAGKLKAGLEMYRMYRTIKFRTYFVTAVVGDREHEINRRRGKIGLGVWIFHMLIHFVNDFYEAVYVFHTSWLTCQVIWMIMLLISSVYLTQTTVKW